MKRKLVAMFMAMSLCMLVPITSNAAEVANTSASEVSIEPRTAKSKSFNAGAHTIRVTGTTVASGYTALVATGFRVTATTDSWESADGCAKIVKYNATVNRQNGQIDNFSDEDEISERTGEVGTTKAYSNLVTSMYANHYVACNGKSLGFNTAD